MWQSCDCLFRLDLTNLASLTGWEHCLKQINSNVRLYVDQPFASGAAVPLEEGQVHYLAHVMRVKLGDSVAVFNGRDGEWVATVSDLSKRSCTLRLEGRFSPQVGVPDLWLCFAPVKRARLDFLVQKATELGVSEIRPVMTRRTVVARVNLDRLRSNVIEAAEQTGRLSVPEIFAPHTLEDLLAHWSDDRALYFCDEESPSDAESAITVLTKDASAKAAILIGPEGGFDPAERDALRAHSFVRPLSLGPRIMRADTAAIAALSLWQATNGDW